MLRVLEIVFVRFYSVRVNDIQNIFTPAPGLSVFSKHPTAATCRMNVTGNGGASMTISEISFGVFFVCFFFCIFIKLLLSFFPKFSEKKTNKQELDYYMTRQVVKDSAQLLLLPTIGNRLLSNQLGSTVIGHIVNPQKCVDYWIMLHCGIEKGANLLPFHSHNAALSDNQCIFRDQQYGLYHL